MSLSFDFVQTPLCPPSKKLFLDTMRSDILFEKSCPGPQNDSMLAQVLKKKISQMSYFGDLDCNDSESSFSEDDEEDNDLFPKSLYHKIEEFLDQENLNIVAANSMDDLSEIKSPVIILNCPKVKDCHKLSSVSDSGISSDSEGPSFLMRRKARSSTNGVLLG